MDNSKLLSPLVPPSIVVVGIPECWVDAWRIARLLRCQPANDNGRSDMLVGAVE